MKKTSILGYYPQNTIGYVNRLQFDDVYHDNYYWYKCECYEEFVGDGVTCDWQPTNECETGSHQCSSNAQCRIRTGNNLDF